MNPLLTWEQAETTLLFSGTLNRDSLLLFWDKKQPLLEHIEKLDVSGLEHVDSTGLAMLVRLKGEFLAKNRTLSIIGVSDNLNTLIELYGVTSLLLD